MARLFLRLAYDGSQYHGWQIQPNGVTVQQIMVSEMQKLLQHPINLTGCGRTDTGVHAREFYAHFDSDHPLVVNPSELVRRLNRMLPSDIVVYEGYHVADHCNSRFDAISRTYKYYTTFSKNPFERNWVVKLNKHPDVELMNRAATVLYDFLDFTSFSKLHTQTATNNCKITEAHWANEGNNLVFTITADRFLRNMVRAVVGTLLEVGYGKESIDSFRTIIEIKDRCRAGMSVPAHGLFLEKVTYPDGYFD